MSDFANALATTYSVGKDIRETARERRQRRAVEDEYGITSGGDPETAIKLATERRNQTEFAAERAKEVTLSALSAFSNRVNSINSSTSIEERFRPEAYAAAFDQIVPALSASGYDVETIKGLRDTLVANPQAASDILRGLSPEEAASYAPRAVLDEQGRPVYVRPGDEIGRVDASLADAQERTRLSGTRAELADALLNQRIAEKDPTYIEESAYAKTGGSGRAEVALTLPRLDEITDTAISRINGLLSDKNLGAIFGLPDLRRLDTGGFGAFGVVPGSVAANTLARLNETVGDVQTAAYESLRGGGQITEAERTAIAQGIASLERAQSLPEVLRALTNLASVLDRRRDAAHRTASTPLTGRRGEASAPSPAAPSTPQFDIDSLLSERGL